MNLINELYKLIYQLRLKRNDNINNDQISLLLVKNLQNLSYDNIVILTLTKNYLTLINFLSNLIQELKRIKDSEDKKQNMANSFDCDYYSNINLIYLIINLIVHHKNHNQNHIDVVINDTNFNHIWDTQINETIKTH